MIISVYKGLFDIIIHRDTTSHRNDQDYLWILNFSHWIPIHRKGYMYHIPEQNRDTTADNSKEITSIINSNDGLRW